MRFRSHFSLWLPPSHAYKKIEEKVENRLMEMVGGDSEWRLRQGDEVGEVGCVMWTQASPTNIIEEKL